MNSSPFAGAASFHFSELCAAVTGPADFTALAQHYHTLFITGVPAMSMQVGCALCRGLVGGRESVSHVLCVVCAIMKLL